MLRTACILITAAWMAAGTARAQTEPPELYLQCYFQIQEADKLKSEGRIVEAYDKYREALERLQGISKTHPDWRQDLVKYRTRYCSDEIARLKDEAAAKRAESGQPAAPASAPQPVRRSADQREEMLPTVDAQGATPMVAQPAPLRRAPEPTIETTPPPPSPMPSVMPVPRSMAQTSPKPTPNTVAPPAPEPVPAPISIPQVAMTETPTRGAAGGAPPGSRGSAGLLTPMPQVAMPEASPPAAADSGELSRRVAELSGQLERTRSDLESTKVELGKTQQQLKAAVSERDGIRTMLEQTQTELKAAKEDTRIAALMQENADLKGRLQDADRQITALKSVDAQNSLKALQGQLDSTKEQLTRAQEENRVYEQTTRELRGQLEGLQKKLADTEAKMKAPGTAPEVARVMEENEVLRAVVDRQLKEQARREAAKKMALDELKTLEIQSDVLAKQIEILATPLVELSANEIAMLRLTVPPAAGAEGNVIAEPLDGTAPAAGKSKAPLDSVPADMAPVAKTARLFFDQGKYDEAARQYQQIIARYPDNLYALSNLGVVRFQQGRYKEAEDALTRSIKAAPNDGFSHSILGIVYYMTTRFDEAVSTLTRAATLEPNDAQTHNYLGIACSRKGWQQVAEQEVRKAIELNPNYGDAHFNLAVIYATQNPPAKEMARRHYKTALQLGLPADPELEKLLN